MKIRIALAQINVTVGDLEGNQAKIADFLAQSKRQGADVVVFPELALTGYPPEDLLFKPTFIEKTQAALKKLASHSNGVTAMIGFVDRDRQDHPYNAAAVVSGKRMVACYHKMVLPNYGVFDEKRYFTPGKQPMVLGLVGGPRIGLSICEDIWVDEGPCRVEAASGAGILVNLSASPYHAGKLRERERLLIRRALEYKSWVCYVNLVGGQDELVFDGGSLVVNPLGRIAFRAPQFAEGLFLIEIPVSPHPHPLPSGEREKGEGYRTVSTIGIPWKPTRSKGKVSRSTPALKPDQEIFEALVLGTRDYCTKNRFSHVVLGLSGGIDSALTAAIAVAALGKEKVTAVSMPSRYSSEGTQNDARTVAQALGVQFLEIPIESVFQAFLKTVAPLFGDRPADVTEENLQARIRGVLLMALSNKFHWLVLSTGNKSELSTGYCTLYGDMVGGFAVIKDVPKTWVYRLSRTANRYFKRTVIPRSVFTRPPTAELKPDQKDQDTLPPYERLDRIVKAYVEEDRSAFEIRKATRIPKPEVDRVLKMIDANEYKRRQAPIGIKITPRALGKDRRMPITNRYQEA